MGGEGMGEEKEEKTENGEGVGVRGWGGAQAKDERKS